MKKIPFPFFWWLATDTNIRGVGLADTEDEHSFRALAMSLAVPV